MREPGELRRPRRLLGRAELYAPYLSGSVAIVTNQVVAPLYLPSLRKAFEKTKVTEIVVGDGEQAKDWPTLNRVFDALLQARCGRDAWLLLTGPATAPTPV